MTVLKSVAKGFLRSFRKTLKPPTSVETMRIEKLRSSFRKIPERLALNAPPSEAAWIRYMNVFREDVLNKDPRDFLNWPVIEETMCASFALYLRTELAYLRSLRNWPEWRSAIERNEVGNPIPYPLYPRSTGNLIHHAYHLARFQEATGCNLKELDVVFEFGGGYGCAAYLIHRLGFRGRYVIQDLPAFQALQSYYLSHFGIEVEHLSTPVAFMGKSLFLASWSLSESPLSAREPVLPAVRNFNYFLIGYQPEGGEVNNVQYFSDWQRQIPRRWQTMPIRHIPGNNAYLFGC